MLLMRRSTNQIYAETTASVTLDILDEPQNIEQLPFSGPGPPLRLAVTPPLIPNGTDVGSVRSVLEPSECWDSPVANPLLPVAVSSARRNQRRVSLTASLTTSLTTSTSTISQRFPEESADEPGLCAVVRPRSYHSGTPKRTPALHASHVYTEIPASPSARPPAAAGVDACVRASATVRAGAGAAPIQPVAAILPADATASSAQSSTDFNVSGTRVQGATTIDYSEKIDCAKVIASM